MAEDDSSMSKSTREEDEEMPSDLAQAMLLYQGHKQEKLYPNRLLLTATIAAGLHKVSIEDHLYGQVLKRSGCAIDTPSMKLLVKYIPERCKASGETDKIKVSMMKYTDIADKYDKYKDKFELIEESDKVEASTFSYHYRMLRFGFLGFKCKRNEDFLKFLKENKQRYKTLQRLTWDVFFLLKYPGLTLNELDEEYPFPTKKDRRTLAVKTEEAAAKKKKKDEEAAAKKKKTKKDDEEAAAKKKDEDAAASKKKEDEEATSKEAEPTAVEVLEDEKQESELEADVEAQVVEINEVIRMAKQDTSIPEQFRDRIGKKILCCSDHFVLPHHEKEWNEYFKTKYTLATGYCHLDMPGTIVGYRFVGTYEVQWENVFLRERLGICTLEIPIKGLDKSWLTSEIAAGDDGADLDQEIHHYINNTISTKRVIDPNAEEESKSETNSKTKSESNKDSNLRKKPTKLEFDDDDKDEGDFFGGNDDDDDDDHNKDKNLGAKAKAKAKATAPTRHSKRKKTQVERLGFEESKHDPEPPKKRLRKGKRVTARKAKDGKTVSLRVYPKFAGRPEQVNTKKYKAMIDVEELKDGSIIYHCPTKQGPSRKRSRTS